MNSPQFWDGQIHQSPLPRLPKELSVLCAFHVIDIDFKLRVRSPVQVPGTARSTWHADIYAQNEGKTRVPFRQRLKNPHPRFSLQSLGLIPAP